MENSARPKTLNELINQFSLDSEPNMSREYFKLLNEFALGFDDESKDEYRNETYRYYSDLVKHYDYILPKLNDVRVAEIIFLFFSEAAGILPRISRKLSVDQNAQFQGLDSLLCMDSISIDLDWRLSNLYKNFILAEANFAIGIGREDENPLILAEEKLKYLEFQYAYGNHSHWDTSPLGKHNYEVLRLIQTKARRLIDGH